MSEWGVWEVALVVTLGATSVAWLVACAFAIRGARVPTAVFLGLLAAPVVYTSVMTGWGLIGTVGAARTAPVELQLQLLHLGLSMGLEAVVWGLGTCTALLALAALAVAVGGRRRAWEGLSTSGTARWAAGGVAGVGAVVGSVGMAAYSGSGALLSASCLLGAAAALGVVAGRTSQDPEDGSRLAALGARVSMLALASVALAPAVAWAWRGSAELGRAASGSSEGLALASEALSTDIFVWGAGGLFFFVLAAVIVIRVHGRRLLTVRSLGGALAVVLVLVTTLALPAFVITEARPAFAIATGGVPSAPVNPTVARYGGRSVERLGKALLRLDGDAVQTPPTSPAVDLHQLAGALHPSVVELELLAAQTGLEKNELVGVNALEITAPTPWPHVRTTLLATCRAFEVEETSLRFIIATPDDRNLATTAHVACGGHGPASVPDRVWVSPTPSDTWQDVVDELAALDEHDVIWLDLSAP